VATLARIGVAECDGFRLESAEGLLGWVEETWRDAAAEPAALAVRTIDGRRALLLADGVIGVSADTEAVFARPGAVLLELAAPRVELIRLDDGHVASASATWATTGDLVEPPPPPGPIRSALLARRPWRLARPSSAPAERPLWLVIATLYTAIAVMTGLFIAAAFLVAYLVTGRAY